MSMPSAVLVERDAEIAMVDGLLDEAHHGRGGLLAFEGEPGIGKTALVQAAIGHAGGAGMHVLAARGSELERSFAFGVVRQALERAVRERDDLFAGPAALARAALAAPGEQSGAAATEGTLHGLYWLLAELADTQPLLVAVDDAHWADEESVAFLRFVTLRLAGVAAAVVVATRPPAAEEALAGLLADPAVAVARPSALGVPGTLQFLQSQLDREPSPAFVAACHAATGGNPFLLAQAAQALQAEGVEPTADEAPRVAELRPRGLARSVLARLDAPARDLARAVAILGDDVSVRLAAGLARLEPAAAEPAADALAAVGVLADRRPLRFRHELWRGAVLAEMSAGGQASAHAAAVRLLREQGAAPERMAAHLLHVEPGAEPTAVATLRDAAGLASARGAPASAASLLRRALGEPLGRDERVAVLMELGAAEQSLGRSEAFERFAEAWKIAREPDGRVAAAIAAGRAVRLDRTHSTRALELLDAIELQGTGRDTMVRVLNARLAAAFPDVGRFHAVAAEAQALGPIAGATPDERRLLAHLARARLEAGSDAAEVAALAERAMDARAVDDAGWFITMIVALTAVDQHAAAERLLQHAIDRARERGALGDYGFAMVWQARIAWFRGDLQAAEGLARAALEATELLGGWWRLTPASVLIDALVDQGRVRDAGRAWTGTGLGKAVPPQRSLTSLLHARARLRLAEGDPASALDDLQDVTRRLGSVPAETVHGLTTRLHTAEAQHALGHHDEALREAFAAVRIARRFAAASSLGEALRVHGRLTGDEEILREAVDRLRDAPARLELARALVDLGATMRRRGARQESREALRAGHELALVCAARGLAERARDELAASGVHVERGDLARRDELTPSERRIARMAAEGASNKEIAQSLFLTVKTVEMHLSNAYRKLDIRSRRDLGSALTASIGESE